MQRLWLFWFWHNWIVYYLVMLWMVILPQCKNLLSYLYDKSHPGLKIFFIRQSAHENLSPFLSHSWWYIKFLQSLRTDNLSSIIYTVRKKIEWYFCTQTQDTSGQLESSFSRTLKYIEIEKMKLCAMRESWRIWDFI